MDDKEKELLKTGIILGNALACLNDVQFNTVLSRAGRIEARLFNPAPNEEPVEEFDIDINKNND